MSTLLPHLSIRVIFLCILVLGYLGIRLLGFRIGPRKWTRWFWGESSDKEPAQGISKSK
jgi:hypothetical protein